MRSVQYANARRWDANADANSHLGPDLYARRSDSVSHADRYARRPDSVSHAHRYTRRPDSVSHAHRHAQSKRNANANGNQRVQRIADAYRDAARFVGNSYADVDANALAQRYTTATPVSTPIQGDANCNGHVDLDDVLAILEESDGLADSCAGTASLHVAIDDVNCDGVVNGIDSLDVLRDLVGVSELSIPTGCPKVGEAL